MPELKIYPSKNVRKADFELFAKDLGDFLEAFTQELLAKWMGRDPGNLSKKLNGNEAITRNDLRDFYSTVSSVLTRLRNGVPPYQIELEMAPIDEAPEALKKRNLWEEIRLIKETLQVHGAAIQELKSGRKGPEDEKVGENS
jgi:hypothetical protein